MPQAQTITVRVPASTTNLGHGFDCLGMALGLCNLIQLDRRGDAQVLCPGLGEGGQATAGMAAAVRAEAARQWGAALPGFDLRITGDVPSARGMGSSATIVVGVASGLRRLAGLADDPQAVLAVAAACEGHPDNVAAATLGGLTVAAQLDGGLRVQRFAISPRLRAVLAIPGYEVKTSQARAILPSTLSKAEHIRGIQRTGLIVAAFAAGDFTALAGCFAEAWHEHYRAELNPLLAQVRAATGGLGLGTILSGSGSTVLSFTQADQAAALADRLRQRLDAGVQVREVAFADAGAQAQA